MTDPTQDKPGSSAATLMPLVYDELRRLARAHLGGGDRQTLQATALVNEAYLKLTEKSQVAGCSHEEFVRLAARVMRNLLVDHLRAKRSDKRGGRWQRITLTAVSDSGSVMDLDLLALNEALEELGKLNPRKAQLVELRFFGGLTESEAAAALGISRTEATRQWRLARAWLQNRLRAEGERL